MILGIGVDIIDISRIKKLCEKDEVAFLNRILSIEEQKIASAIKAKNKARFYNYIAKRFAAKEAFSKAIGTGIGKDIKFTDISILNEDSGKPFIKLTDNTTKLLANITPENQTAKIDISISDEPPMAIAMVLISAKIISMK